MNVWIPSIAFLVAVALIVWLVQKNLKSNEDKMRSELEIQIKKLAEEALKLNGEHFLKLAQGKLEEEREKQKSDLQLSKKEVENLVKPLAESVDKYKKELESIEALRNKEYGSMGETLKCYCSAIKS